MFPIHWMLEFKTCVDEDKRSVHWYDGFKWNQNYTSAETWQWTLFLEGLFFFFSLTLIHSARERRSEILYTELHLLSAAPCWNVTWRLTACLHHDHCVLWRGCFCVDCVGFSSQYWENTKIQYLLIVCTYNTALCKTKTKTSLFMFCKKKGSV